ncbi:MAG: hypothetical protein AAFZ87_13805 [Planctomycetota bacterium]
MIPAPVHALLGQAALVGAPLAAQPQENDWFQRLLGFVVLFFVVLWPVIRGIIETATARRKEFEQQQRRAAGRGPARRRPTLEEILRGEPGPGPFEDEAVPAEALRRTESRSTTSPGAPPPLPPSRRRPTPRPTQRPTEPAARAGRLSTLGPELAGDPFDESQMGRDLVDDAVLPEVPSEDEMEERFDEAAAAAKLRAQGDARAREHQRAERAPEAAPGAKALRNLEARLTPWQRAFVFKELLGPPRAVEPFRGRR